MKKVLILYVLLVVVVVVFLLSRGGNLFKFNLFPDKTTGTLTINSKTYKLLLAKSDAEKQKGLSGRSNLAKNTGMLFIFPKKDVYPFWMKDMKFPIDIIYIDDAKVVSIFENVPAPTKDQTPAQLPIYRPDAPANYVLELNAKEVSSNKIKVGDTVILKGIK